MKRILLSLGVNDLDQKDHTQVFSEMDLVADSYDENSIKATERLGRGIGDKVEIKSAHSKIPTSFQSFLKNSENESRMVEIIFKVMMENKAKFLTMMKTNKLILSTKGSCKVLTHSNTETITDLVVEFEEADSRVIAHTQHALNTNTQLTVKIRSPSADTDISILAVSLLLEGKERVYLENGNESNKKILWLGSIEMSDMKRKVLLGFHAFTGNDYVSSFFRKGKLTCWKIIKRNERFENFFSELGSGLEVDTNITMLAEEYVINLYGGHGKDLDAFRYKIVNTQMKKNKIPDLCNVPPCKAVMQLHLSRANLVAYMWRMSTTPGFQMPDITRHEWESDGSIRWITQAFPLTVENIIRKHDDIEYGGEAESDNEDKLA